MRHIWALWVIRGALSERFDNDRGDNVTIPENYNKRRWQLRL